MPAHSCPFLGLPVDRSSYLAYASPANACHRARRITHIEVEYQQAVCLAGAHAQCPVFRSEGREKLPKEAVAPDFLRRRAVRYWAQRILILLAVVLIAAAGVYLYQVQLPAFVFAAAQPTQVPAYNIPRYENAQPTLENYAPRILLAPNLSTPDEDSILIWQETPGSSETPQAKPAAYPNLQVVRVAYGDNLYALAEKFNTSEQAIIDLNDSMRVPLWVDEVIVIPVDLQDVNGLPKFKPVEIQQRTSVEQIAQSFGCSAELFKLYNPGSIVIEDGIDLVPGPTWVLIPRVEPANQP